MKAGKESYYIVSKFEYFEYAKVAPLFGKLARSSKSASVVSIWSRTTFASASILSSAAQTSF